MSLVMEPVARLTRDIRSGAATLGRNEARYPTCPPVWCRAN